MSSRIDEIKSTVKKGIGSLTGNEEMQREGQAEADKAKLERETEGAIDKGVGKAQETVGKATGDTETEFEGKARQVEGDLKRTG